MKKIGDVTSTADKNGEWTNGNVAAGIAPTILEAGWLNSVQREILGVILAAGLQQDKNDDTQLSKAISKIISGGDYATAEDLKKYLAKDQNGADIPDKELFIENLGIVIPEVPDATTQKKGIVQLDAKVTKGSVNVPTSGAVYDALSGLLKPGFTMLAMLDEADISPPWYVINGDRYGIETPQGKVLRSFSADLKARWNVVQTADTITLPRVLQPDGRMPFPRPVNGTNRKTGVVSGDTIRNINGEIGYDATHGLASSDNDVSGAFYRFGASKRAFSDVGASGQTTNIAFSADKVVPTGPENKPLDIGVTWVVYLGV